MNRDEIKAEAKRVGLKVRENFMDDWPENTAILGFGVVLGILIAKFFL